MTEENSLVVSKPALLRPIAKPQELMDAHTELIGFVQNVLSDGQDYGPIPGAGKKSVLLKPGAERLCIGFGLKAEFDVIESESDHNVESPYALTKWVKRQKPSSQVQDAKKAEGTGRNKKYGQDWSWEEKEEEAGIALGLYRYVIRCRLLVSDGREVGQGVGSCSSLESKYIRSPRDFENTVLKMAKKRAFVDATLTTLGLSDRFTQDVEDHIRRDDEPNRGVEPPQEMPKNASPGEKERNATAYIRKTINMGRDQFAEYKAACEEQGNVTWAEFALEAEQKGITTFNVLMKALMEGFPPPDVLEAEFTEGNPLDVFDPFA